MNHCSHCAAENTEGARFCGSCGGRMEAAIQPAAPEVHAPEYPAMRGMAPVRASVPEPHHPAMRGMAMAATAEQGMRSLATTVEGAINARAGTQFASGKSPQLATGLSFIFPGGGQFYNGDTKKGFAVFALAILASCLTLYAGAWFLGVPLSLGTWVWSMIDAGKVARREKALW